MKTREQRATGRALTRAVKEEQHRIREQTLGRIRSEIEAIKRRRVELTQRVRGACKAARARSKERIAERRRAVREALSRELGEMRQAEKNRCALRRARVKYDTMTALERKRHELEEARRADRFVEKLERHKKRHERKHSKAERAQESDDEVRSNIHAELLPIFEKVKRSIKARPGRSRTEAFLQWVEENNDEVWRLREKEAEAKLMALIREEERARREHAKAARAVGKRPARAPVDLSAIPF